MTDKDSTDDPEPTTHDRQPPPGLRHADFWWLHLLLIGVAVVAVAYAAWTLWPSEPLTHPGPSPSAGVEVPLDEERSDVTVRHDAQATWVIHDPTVPQHLLASAPTVLASAIAVAVALLMLSLSRSIERGAAFSFAAVRRLRWLGHVLMWGGIAHGFIRPWCDHFLWAQFLTDPPAPPIVGLPTLVAVLAGSLALALTSVLRRGIQLQDDTQGLV